MTMDQSESSAAYADNIETGLNARDMSRLSDLLAKAVRVRQTDSAPPTSRLDGNLAGVAEELYRIRRKREAIFNTAFGDGLFADPAWDLLLDLYIHNTRQRKISVSSACLAATVPTTTALRYITELLKRGLIERVPHPLDGRSYLLNLTAPAIQSMESLLCQLQPIPPANGAEAKPASAMI
jgi:DNA-binding MarR family transcriptional regulator